MIDMTDKVCGNKGELRYTLWRGRQAPGPLCVLLPEEEDTEKSLMKKAELILAEKAQEKHPSWLLVPWCYGGWEKWEQALALHELLFDLSEQESLLDGCRFYLLGGQGAWAVASRFPSRFAAVAAFAGPRDPYQARNLKFVPFWGFERKEYGLAAECSVALGPQGTSCRKAVMALRTCGAENARYTCLQSNSASSALWRQAAEETEFLSWLFSQDRRKQFAVHYLRPGLFRIDDYFTSSAYLVCGTQKALLIDTGMGEGDLAGLVRSLTPLPVELAVTHPHQDHMAHAASFSSVWMQSRDAAAIWEQSGLMDYMKSRGFSMPSRKAVFPLEAGSKIDLGGGVIIEALDLPGHTPHSLVFKDSFHKSIFTGDAIGSGYIVLMICRWEEWRKRISDYQTALRKFRDNQPDLEDYAWYGGHFIQENGCDMRRQEWYLSGKSLYFNPISGRVVEDMITLCTMLLEGLIPEEQLRNSPEHHAQWREAGVSFRFL